MARVVVATAGARTDRERRQFPSPEVQRETDDRLGGPGASRGDHRSGGVEHRPADRIELPDSLVHEPLGGAAGLGQGEVLLQLVPVRPKPCLLELEPPVDEPLEALAKRRVERGDDQGRADDGRVGCLVGDRDEDPLRQADGCGEGPRQDRCQRTVDQGAVDETVDVVQAVAGDRDADRDGQCGEQQRPELREELRQGSLGHAVQGEHRHLDERHERDPADLGGLDGRRPPVSDDQRDRGEQEGDEDQHAAGRDDHREQGSQIRRRRQRIADAWQQLPDDVRSDQRAKLVQPEPREADRDRDAPAWSEKPISREEQQDQRGCDGECRDEQELRQREELEPERPRGRRPAVDAIARREERQSEPEPEGDHEPRDPRGRPPLDDEGADEREQRDRSEEGDADEVQAAAGTWGRRTGPDDRIPIATANVATDMRTPRRDSHRSRVVEAVADRVLLARWPSTPGRSVGASRGRAGPRRRP